MKENTPAIGIIGGSGLYQMEQLRNATEQRIETPFGSPSDALIGGNITAATSADGRFIFCRGMAEGTAFSRTN